MKIVKEMQKKQTEKIIKKMEITKDDNLTVQHSKNNAWQKTEGFGFFMMKNCVWQLKEIFDETEKHWLDNTETYNIYYI